MVSRYYTLINSNMPEGLILPAYPVLFSEDGENICLKDACYVLLAAPVVGHLFLQPNTDLDLPLIDVLEMYNHKEEFCGYYFRPKGSRSQSSNAFLISYTKTYEKNINITDQPEMDLLYSLPKFHSFSSDEGCSMILRTSISEDFVNKLSV